MTDSQQWYRDVFLKSTHFAQMREKRYKTHPQCEISGKKFNLDPHHLSYERAGTKDEWRDLRMLDHKFHRECHFIFFFFKIPLTPAWLYSRYLFVKVRFRVLRRLHLTK